MPVPRKREYLEIQRERNAVMEGISPGWKMSFQNSGNLVNMNVTTFSSL
jgi:hypothetical protein